MLVSSFWLEEVLCVGHDDLLRQIIITVNDLLQSRATHSHQKHHGDLTIRRIIIGVEIAEV
jgi:hypothetical protein